MQTFTSVIKPLRLLAISVAGACCVLLVSAAAEPAPAAPFWISVALDSTGPAALLPVTSAPEWRPSAEDSLRAEAQLSPGAINRPLQEYFGRFSRDRVLVRRISRAVLRESRRQQVPPSLIAAVLVTENTTLRPEAVSMVGALGLMQVMPMHAGAQLCGSDDLVDVDSNICHGTMILARNLRVTKTPVAALLRYNGCVRGTNTPDCHRYPGRVLTRASRVRQQILASTGALVAAEADSVPVLLAGR